jgi:hypothetical protein
MSPRPALVLALPCVALLGLASPAWGASAQDQAAAAELFQAGKQLAAAGDYAHACPKLVESQRLGPTSGTLLSIGDCYEKLGKLASAYGAFREAEVSARGSGDQARQAEAVRRAEILAPQLARLAITVPPVSRVPGFELKRDGTVMGEGQWGSALPIDVGYHDIVATAPGYRPWTSTIRIDTNGSSASVQVQPLEKLPEGAAGGATGFTWNAQRIAGVSIASVGALSAAAGAILGVEALSKKASADAQCTGPTQSLCNSVGFGLRYDEKHLGNASTGTLIAGGILLASGLVVLLTPPRSTRETAVRLGIAIRVAGVGIDGRW